MIKSLQSCLWSLLIFNLCFHWYAWHDLWVKLTLPSLIWLNTWCKEGAVLFGKGKIMHIYLFDINLNEAPQIQFQKQLQEEVETFPHIFSWHKFYFCRVRSTVFSFWRKWLACACCLYNLSLWFFTSQARSHSKHYVAVGIINLLVNYPDQIYCTSLGSILGFMKIKLNNMDSPKRRSNVIGKHSLDLGRWVFLVHKKNFWMQGQWTEERFGPFADINGPF